MATAIKMPKLGLSMVEGTVVQWLKLEGDSVEEGDPLVVIETDKIVNEVDASQPGILRHILVQDGDVAPVSGTIGIMGAADEDIDVAEFAKEVTVPEAALPAGFDPKTTRLGREGRGSFGGTADAEAGPPADAPAPALAQTPEMSGIDQSGGGRIKVSPVARTVASDKGVDLRSLRGSGPGGRIVKSDVEEAAANRSRRSRPQPTAFAGAAAPDFSYPTPHYGLMRRAPDRRPLAGSMRRVIAENMRRSKNVAAHATMSLLADVSKLVALRGVLVNEFSEKHGVRITYTDLVVKACARLLISSPGLRTVIDGDELVTLNDIDIAVAVHLGESGLVVPVIRDCDTLSLIEIARERTRLIEDARVGSLDLDDVLGGCFTITNMGAVYDIDMGTPVMNLPQSAILGTSSIKDRVIAVDGEAVVRPTMNLFLSIDHCLVDGEPAVRFLNELRDILENAEIGFAIH